MDLGDVPVWVQSVGALLGATVAAGAISWNERRRDRDKSPPHAPGDAQVVAATFVEKGLMERLIVATTTLHGEMVKLNDNLGELNKHNHDEELVRAAAARMREGRT